MWLDVKRTTGKKLYPNPISNVLRYKISIIKYSIIYFVSLLVLYLMIQIPLDLYYQKELFPLKQLLVSGLVVSFYFIFLAILIYQRIITRVRKNLETESIRELSQLLHDQKQESIAFHKELQERTELLEKQSEEIRFKNLELKLAQHEIKEKANFLEIASKYKSEFFANISHELRTPLNSIIVLSQLIAENRSNNLTEKQKEFAKTIYASGNVLLDFINEILELTKIESGKIEIHPEYINLWELADQLKMMFQPVAQQKGLEFSIELEENLTERILSDSKRLHQILRNLISNAIKFTEIGSVCIRICKPHKDEISIKGANQQVVAFKVIDSGIGVAENKRTDIFEAFQQADGTTSSKYGGTGLGLTISRSLVVLLGGEIHLSSKLGEGSVFTVVVPEKLELRSINEKLLVSSPWKSGETIKGKFTNTSKADCPSADDRENIKKGDKIILIIEDDISFANLLHEFALESGFKCLIANSGECGIEHAKEYQPGLIIMDICLPDKNGWQVFEELKEDPYTSQIPVFFISGAKESNEVSEMGAIGFLTKPVSLTILKKTFESFRTLTGVPVIRINKDDNEDLPIMPESELVKKEDKDKLKQKMLNDVR